MPHKPFLTCFANSFESAIGAECVFNVIGGCQGMELIEVEIIGSELFQRVVEFFRDASCRPLRAFTGEEDIFTVWFEGWPELQFRIAVGRSDVEVIYSGLDGILHHLIGKSLEITRANQQNAISELFRVTKPGGIVLIEEQVNQSRLACGAIYHMSRFASRMKFKSKMYMVTPFTIIGYMTRNNLEALCRNACPDANWLKSDYERWNMPLHWKIVLLLNNTGAAFLAVQKPTG